MSCKYARVAQLVEHVNITQRALIKTRTAILMILALGARGRWFESNLWL